MPLTDGPIRLGLMTPQTGVVGMYGQEIERAARIACAEVNAEGGIRGRPLELIVEDDRSCPVTAVAAARRLVLERRCSALVGNLMTNARLAVAQEVAARLHLPYLNFSFHEGSVADRHFFHFAALPNQQIEPLIQCMSARHGPKMIFAGHNYEWPRGSIDAATRCLADLGGDTLGEVYLDFAAGPEQFDALLDDVTHSGADVFLPFFAGADQLMVLRRFGELGLRSRMALACCHFDEVMAAQLPAALRGGYYACNTYFMGIDNPANQRMLARLEDLPEVDGLWPDGHGVLSHFGEGAYLCVKAFAAAARIGGSARDGLLAALRTIGVDGPQGEVRIDPFSQHAWVNVYLARSTAHGRFELLEHFARRPPRLPLRYGHVVGGDTRGQEAADPPVGAASDGTAASILAIAEAAIIACELDGRIVEANAAVCDLFGYREEELLGQSIHQLLPPHLRARHTEQVGAFIQSGERVRSMANRREVMGYRRDGSFVPLEVAIARIDAVSGTTLVATVRDVSDRKRYEQALLRRATHDSLTGLPARRLINERVSHSLMRAHLTHQPIALLYIDLDGFKEINDTYGHALGDRLLCEVAQRLLAHVRPGDTVGRMAGDEFVVLCEQVGNPESIGRLAGAICGSIRDLILLDDVPVHLGASVGIALSSDDAQTADELVRSADSAMYEAKQSARGSWRFFSDALYQRTRQRVAITQALHGVLERNELSLRLQPIIDAATRRIVAAELLLRWTSQDGELPPDLFVPIAEMSGAIVPIGEWVFQRACEIEVGWRRRHGNAGPRYLAVNVSTRQLAKPDLDRDFAAILARTGASPRHLLLEITETALMADIESTLGVLHRLSALGLRIAVDDFGTGYSSLAQLTRMPVGVLKVDRAFVSRADHQPEQRAVVRAIVSLGKALGLSLVAEGVETEQQFDEVSQLGCELVQGYLFYRPLTLADFEGALAGEATAVLGASVGAAAG